MTNLDFSDSLLANSEWLCAEDLVHDKQEFTIKNYEKITEKNEKGKLEPKMVLHLEETEKKYKPAKTQRRVVCNKEYANWGGTATPDWIGRKIEVFKAKVLFKGKEVDGVRLCGLSDIPKDFVAVVIEGKREYRYPIRKIERAKKESAPEKEKVWSGKEGANVRQENSDKAKLAYDAIITELDAPQSDFDAVIAKHDKVIARFKEAYPDYYETIMSYKPEELPPVEAYTDSIAASDEIDLF